MFDPPLFPKSFPCHPLSSLLTNEKQMNGDMLRIHIEITVIYIFFVKRNEKADEKLLQPFDPLLYPSVSPSSSSSIQTNEKGIKGEIFCFRINITCMGKWEAD